jgi:Family of unknown function (DUF6412)
MDVRRWTACAVGLLLLAPMSTGMHAPGSAAVPMLAGLGLAMALVALWPARRTAAMTVGTGSTGRPDVHRTHDSAVRQCDPDAAGHVRARAPGLAGRSHRTFP